MRPNPRIGFYYLSVAVAGLLLGWQFPFLRIPMLWICGACVWLACGYFFRGFRVYRKHRGRLSVFSSLFLFPIRLGQVISWVYYRRQCRPWDEVVPGVYIGRVLTSSEARALKDQGVNAVLDLTAEFSETPELITESYLNIPVLDLTAPTSGDLEQAMAFMRDHPKVFVHCKVGYSRSAAVVGSFLIKEGMASSAEEAVDLLRKARPQIVIRPEVMSTLKDMETRCSFPPNTPPA